jgi:uncharacterized membrane protein
MVSPGPYYHPGGMDGPRRRIRRWVLAISATFVVAATVLLLVVIDPRLFGLPAGPYPYRYGAFGGVLFVLLILLVVFFIARVLFWTTRMGRYGGRGPGGMYGPERPAMIARMRYARGEITREQFQQIMEDLGRRPGPP